MMLVSRKCVVEKNVRVWIGHTRGLPWVINVQLVENENRPIPSLLLPAPKRFLTKECLPLSTMQMIEMAVRRGNGYCGIHSQRKMTANTIQKYLRFLWLSRPPKCRDCRSETVDMRLGKNAYVG